MATATTEKKETKKAPAKAPKSDVFAVIETGGKQYKVSEGQTIKIEKVRGIEEGGKISFDKVLLTDNGKTTKIGEPYVSGAKVDGEVTKLGRAKKVNVVKYKAKSRYHKKRGHRQPFTEVKIVSL